MKRLRDCPSAAVPGRRYRIEISETRAAMSLAIEDSEPLAAYALDTDAWSAPGKRPDGVIVSEWTPGPFVCFVELKGAFDEKGLDQLEAGVDHFAPSGRSHGAEHHAAFALGQDLPLGQRRPRESPTEVRPAPEHSVGGVLMVARRGTRVPPRIIVREGKRVALVVVQHHGGRAEWDAAQLARELGLTD